VISTQAAISKTRRDLTLATLLRWALIGAAVLTLFVQPLLDEWGNIAVAVLFGLGAVWFVLSFRSMRGSRIAADSSSLIASGQYELAEQHIAEALGSFSIFRTVKLMSLHHLAMLRHAQSRWQESAMLCRALLTQRLAQGSGLDRSSRLILAEALLELNDLPGVHDALARLYDQRLPLREALNLLTIQLDYQAKVGAWTQIFDQQVMKKVELAELLPTPQAARAQALLALSARKVGREDWADWLRKRVELLVDPQKLCTDRPILWELWRQ
jgi:hypothetical protein